MKAYNIDWDIDIEEAFEKLDEMNYKSAASALGISADDYANMTTEERHDFAYDLFHHCPGELEDFMDLPTKVEIPKELTNEEDITEWLSDEYGFCIKGYKLDTDEG